VSYDRNRIVASRVSEPPPPERERRRTVGGLLYDRLVVDGESFWTAVYPGFMRREITKDTLREIVRRGLEEARGSYRRVVPLFNMLPSEYEKFVGFLRKYDCHISTTESR